MSDEKGYRFFEASHLLRPPKTHETHASLGTAGAAEAARAVPLDVRRFGIARRSPSPEGASRAGRPEVEDGHG